MIQLVKGSSSTCVSGVDAFAWFSKAICSNSERQIKYKVIELHTITCMYVHNEIGR